MIRVEKVTGQFTSISNTQYELEGRKVSSEGLECPLNDFIESINEQYLYSAKRPWKVEFEDGTNMILTNNSEIKCFLVMAKKMLKY
jgi:hypothetical protein